VRLAHTGGSDADELTRLLKLFKLPALFARPTRNSNILSVPRVTQEMFRYASAFRLRYLLLSPNEIHGSMEGNMSVAFGTLEQYTHREPINLSGYFSRMANRLGEIFGCQHKEMSRPFSRHGETYRVCINCGARRQFDKTTWKSSGRHYHKPARLSDLQDVDMTALRPI
jgi:hypothetical protein